MENRRVVITGLGIVAPNGTGTEAFWDSLVHGRSAVSKITQFDASSYPCQVAAEVSDFEPTDYMDSRTARRLSRFARFALAASRLAVDDAGLDCSALDSYRVGVVIGTGIGGGDCIEEQYAIFAEKGIRRLSPFGAVMICSHSAAGIISCEHHIHGPSMTISSGCTSGLDAICSAYNTIRLGEADVMLVGAGEAPITPCSVALFCTCGLLSKNNGDMAGLRPYDVNGNGTIIGEGGALLILEELQTALRRKARIYAEVAGYASGNEAYNIFERNPSGEAVSVVIRRALGNAGLEPRQIDYINGHGNGSPAYDVGETVAIKKAFGEWAYKIPVSSIKPVTGQSFSVTGILQMVTCLLAMKTGTIPPTMNHEHPRSDCDLDYVPFRSRKAEIRTALMHALGYGGGHTAVIVRSPEPEERGGSEGHA
jgi:3-oxoacyl-[acyl-carrier-protein] synthase II